MNLYKKYAKNVGLVTIASIILYSKNIILLPILTKSLSVELYGIWTLISVSISLLAPLCTLELGYAIIRFLGAEKDNGKISDGVSSILGVTSFIALIVSILLFLLAKPIAIAVFGGIDVEFYIKISALIIFLSAIDQILIEYFIAFQQMEKYAMIQIMQTIGEVILTAYLLLIGFGLLGVIFTLLIVRIAVFIIGFFWIASQIKIVTPSFPVVKPYLSFTMPILLTALCYSFVNFGDRYVIEYFMGADAVGVYSASYGLGSILAFLYAPLSIALLPAITNLYEDDKIQELKKHLEYSLKLFLMFAIPSVFGLLVISKPLLTNLTTPEYSDGYMVVPIVAFGTILFNCSYISTDILRVFKRTKIDASIYAFSASINLVMNIILVPLIGILGAAIATLITFAVHLLIVTNYSSKYLSFDVDFKFIVKSLISSVIMTFVIWEMNPVSILDILFSTLIGAGVYLLNLILLKGFTKEEYNFFRS